MPTRPVLLVLLSAVLLVACRPTPSDPIEYLHREDSIIIQVLSVDTDASEIERRLAVPEFTLYGDGTLIYQSVSADGTRLLETMLSDSAIRELLEDIVDEGFLDFFYEQPAPEGAGGSVTFIYAHTRDRANAVSVQGANDPLPEDAGDDFDQYRKVTSFVETLRSLDPVAIGGTASVAYLPESYLVVSTGGSEKDVTERILAAEEADGIRQILGGNLDQNLEQLRGPFTVLPEGPAPEEVGIAPLLPFYENFPEFELQ